MFQITYISRHTYSPTVENVTATDALTAVTRFRNRHGEAVPIVAMRRS